MKTGKLALAILAALVLTAGWSVESFAKPALYTCTVKSAGPLTYSSTNPKYYEMAITVVYVSGSPEPTNKTKTFYAPPTYEKEFLAVALTALANGNQVNAYVDFGATAGTTVYNLILLPAP